MAESTEPRPMIREERLAALEARVERLERKVALLTQRMDEADARRRAEVVDA